MFWMNVLYLNEFEYENKYLINIFDFCSSTHPEQTDYIRPLIYLVSREYIIEW